MTGPDEDTRQRVLLLLENLPATDALQADQAEDYAEGALGLIEESLIRDSMDDETVRQGIERLSREGPSAELPEIDPVEAQALLEVLNEWAALASYVSARVYGPASPMPRRLAGWGRRAIQLLQRIAATLLPGLRIAANALRAASVSIGLSFPWGVSIGLSW